MTWGEIQIESLKKMFLNNDNLTVDKLEEYRQDKKYKTYLFAMPQACNEAIKYICNLIPNIKFYNLTVENNRYDLSELIDDFKCVEDIVSDSKIIEWNMETDNILKIDKNAGDVIIYYEAQPKLINQYFSDYSKINIDQDCLVNIPLYIAGELYKDDDLTLSTVYMNEFMNNIAQLANKTKTVKNNKINTIYTMNY